MLRLASRHSLLVLLFGATTFSSAFLMFLVEPLVARMVLPTLGGAPMVWNTCVVFFQVTLVAGYAYAHGATAWLRPGRQAALSAGLLLLPVATLPLVVNLNGAPVDGNPVAWLLGVLTVSIGLPFLALSTSASIFQKMFSRTDHPSARDPYFLYSASNLGSLLALVSYPALVEPTLTLRDQGRIWTGGYILFVALALLCIAIAHRTPSARGREAVPPEGPAAALPWIRRARWVMLAFVPSSLMLAVTSYLSTDIAAVPLLWVVPLGLYLLTFVAAFGSRAATYRRFADRRLPLVVVALAVFMIVHAVGPVWIVLPLHLLGFALAAILCHTELAEDRPSAEHLTIFYFWVSVGGLIGGLFNTLLAPVIFTSVTEYPLVLLLACVCRRRPATASGPLWQPMDYAAPALIGLGTAACLLLSARVGADPRLALCVPAFLCLGQKAWPYRFALSVAAFLVVGSLIPAASSDGRVVYRERTFFGVYRVSLDRSGRYRQLFHGTTLHGMQSLDPSRRGEPLAYFHPTGPFGEAFSALPAAAAPDVAVIGLGVGSLASYARPDQRWTFYEIDPAVERIARTDEYFTYLRACGTGCRVVVGDARRSLAGASSARYGLLVLDAFSSDAIPTHLMTSEALSLYLARLTDDGALAFHISNRHLALGPVVARLAQHQGLVARERVDSLAVEAEGKAPSHWVVMARRPQDLGALATDPRWTAPHVSPGSSLWTDDFSNILGVLSLGLR